MKPELYGATFVVILRKGYLPPGRNMCTTAPNKNVRWLCVVATGNCPDT